MTEVLKTNESIFSFVTRCYIQEIKVMNHLPCLSTDKFKGFVLT